MRSSNREYLSSVDHLRAFAALLIVFYHATQLFSAHLAHLHIAALWLYSDNPLAATLFEGHTAVTLFMVLSGFIFTVGTLGHEVSFGRFMLNRLLRIYPLFLLLALLGTAFSIGSFNPAGLLLTIAGLGNYPGALRLGSASTMFWAVAVEMQFYLLFPLLNRILTRSGIGTFLRLTAAVVMVRAMVWLDTGPTHDPMKSLYLNLAGRIDDFLIGMIAAWLFVHHGKRFRGWWKVAASAAVVVATMWAFNEAHGFSSTGKWRLGWIDWEACMWALVVLTYVATVRSTRLPSRLAAKVGELSYSIYMLHFLLIEIIIKHGWFVTVKGASIVENSLLTAVVVLLPAVLAASVLSYQGIERPFLRLRVKYLLPAAPPTEPDAASQGARPREADPPPRLPAERDGRQAEREPALPS